MRVLIIDADVTSAQRLADHFSDRGAEVITAADFGEGIAKWREKRPVFIILEASLPTKTGLELCDEIRKHSKVPILIYSHKADTDDKILGLKHGADDYVAKPCEPREIYARVETILRRTQPNPRAGTLSFDALDLNLEMRTAKVDGKSISLTGLEFEVLRYFADHAGQILGREDLERLRGTSSDVISRSMDVLLSRLRQKLNDNPKNPRFFKTVRGSGYVFVATRKEQPKEE